MTGRNSVLYGFFLLILSKALIFFYSSIVSAEPKRSAQDRDLLLGFCLKKLINIHLGICKLVKLWKILSTYVLICRIIIPVDKLEEQFF